MVDKNQPNSLAIISLINAHATELNAESQRFQLGLWLKQQGMIFSDDVESPSVTNLHGNISALESRLKMQSCQLVLMWRLSCLDIGLPGALRCLKGLNQKGIRLVAAGDGLDIQPQNNDSITTLYDSLLSLDNSFRSQRQQRGIASASAEGKYRGRQRGTTKAKPVKAKKLKLQGYSLAEIAEALGVTERTVRNYLRS